jgi:hypothetical protein
MEKLDLNKYLKRNKEIDKIKELLETWDKNKDNDTTTTVKKGIYIYGNSGTGKTILVNNILKELNYDAIKYDASDVRNVSIIDDITKTNMSNKNIISLFYNSTRKIAIVMDEIDGMNNGDKGGINALIKLIRPKKTKKQKLEKTSINPVICIGNYRFDKKIRELMKVCNLIEITTPTQDQIRRIVYDNMPLLEIDVKNEIINFVNGDLRKLEQFFTFYEKDKTMLNTSFVRNILNNKIYNNETKKIVDNILKYPYSINDHTQIMNDTDRTSVGLLWHENIIDAIKHGDKKSTIPLYIQQLNNICVSDYIDRITFQNQIWQFNEMTSLIKTFKNASMYHNYKKNNKFKTDVKEIRFTKVLTKYSTEYNNILFIQRLCQTLGMDKYDLIVFFVYIKDKLDDKMMADFHEEYDITKLDINRIYRFIDKYIDENASSFKDKEYVAQHETPYSEDVEC